MNVSGQAAAELSPFELVLVEADRHQALGLGWRDGAVS